MEVTLELVIELKKQAKIWQLKVWVEIQQPKELKVLLIAIYY